MTIANNAFLTLALNSIINALSYREGHIPLEIRGVHTGDLMTTMATLTGDPKCIEWAEILSAELREVADMTEAIASNKLVSIHDYIRKEAEDRQYAAACALSGLRKAAEAALQGVA